MADPRNPYAPPTAPVSDPADPLLVAGEDVFIPNGRRVSPGRGAGWIGDAWRMFKVLPGKWLVRMLILIVIYGVVSIIPFANLLTLFLWPFFGAGIIAAADLQRRTGTFDAGAVFKGASDHVPALLILGAMYLLTMVVYYGSLAAIVGAPAANQIVLGVGDAIDSTDALSGFATATLIYMLIAVPITFATYMAVPLVTIHKLPVGTAMKMSFVGSVKNILPGIVCAICGTVFVLLSIIPLLLGLLVSIPVLMIMSYTIYRDIFTES